ncbi:MAG: SDR family oxidoreductase [Chlamydiae bacterium]|nr:SDR family oxidoreductase [Chlamydiota bacterium]
MHVFVAGGAGYVGAKLIPELLNNGYKVTVYDLYIYGNVLAPHENLVEIKGDVRDLALLDSSLKNIDSVIHLACISNDPSFELNPDLGRSINLDCFEPFVEIAKKNGVKRFIYASSSSVYGVKEESNVTEDMELEPLTDYSKFKAECEKILFKHMSPEFICSVVRPATVCGYSKRQRLDLVVNILTNLAYHTGTVKVMGGSQLRPNIHIDDMVRAYLLLLTAPAELIHGEIFNVGYHNHSVFDIGKMVENIVSQKRPISLEIHPTNDPRSYQVCSEKIYKILGFSPQKTIGNAIEDLLQAFDSGILENPLENSNYYNIKKMKEIDLV